MDHRIETEGKIGFWAHAICAGLRPEWVCFAICSKNDGFRSPNPRTADFKETMQQVGSRPARILPERVQILMMAFIGSFHERMSAEDRTALPTTATE